jgi:hypothetical protein
VFGDTGWEATWPGVARGGQVQVSGLYEEFFDLSEIHLGGSAAPAVIDLGFVGEPAPHELTATELAADPEPWESVLVTVPDLTVTDEDLGFGEFEVEDAAGATLVVDDQIHWFSVAAAGSLTVGYAFDAITGPLNYSFGAYKIEPREELDLVPATSPVGGGVIFDIQQGLVVEGTDGVAVTGVVVTGVGADGIFVQEPDGGEYSGLFVYLGAGWELVYGAVAEGDVLDLVGAYEEFFDNSELSLVGSTTPSLVVVGSAAVPAPAVVTADELSAGESWEGVLVQVVDVEVDDPSSFAGEFTVVDAAAPAGAVVIDDELHLYGGYGALSAGDTFQSITGPLLYAFGSYNIEVRSDADLVP